MMILLKIALRSLISRSTIIFLTIISLSLSILLYLSVDTLRIGAKKSFFGNVKSGDLILGSRSGEIQLLLYSLFQIGAPTNNISWESYKEISKMPEIDWIIPISLGDSHKQFRVMGTNETYFDKFSYRKKKKLEFSSGQQFHDIFDVVIGSDVAKILNYKLEDSIIIAHGISSQSLHDEFPFKIKGILKKTGTSVDRLVLVSLEALEVIHKDWKSGTRIPSIKTEKNKNIKHTDLEPKEITAAVLKIKSPINIFKIQREINNFKYEALQAIIPGIALSKLWQIVSTTENIFLLISCFVIITSLVGMVAILYSTLSTRKREISLLRITGASPLNIGFLMLIEAFLIAFMSIIIAVIARYLIGLSLFPVLDNKYGVFIELKFLSYKDLLFLSLVLFTSIVVSIFPGRQAFKNSINDGM